MKKSLIERIIIVSSFLALLLTVNSCVFIEMIQEQQLIEEFNDLCPIIYPVSGENIQKVELEDDTIKVYVMIPEFDMPQEEIELVWSDEYCEMLIETEKFKFASFMGDNIGGLGLFSEICEYAYDHNHEVQLVLTGMSSGFSRTVHLDHYTEVKFLSEKNYQYFEKIYKHFIEKWMIVDEIENPDALFPTEEEIETINSALPTKVFGGFMCTKCDYDERINTQTFYYSQTMEIDESMITPNLVSELKANMVSEVKKSEGNVARLNAGMILRYIYSSVDGRTLYEISIKASDINE